MVGSIRSRTAVANNDQIVDAVSQGVFEAVVAAMPKYNEQPLEVKVYLDGKEITKKVEKVQRERGTTLLPGGVAFGW
jgi:DNA-binding protein